MTFTAAKTREIRTQINQELEALGKKLGVKIQARNARYDDMNISFKLEVSKLDKKGKAQTPEAVALKQRFPSLAGKKVTIGDEKFKVVGFRTRARTKPFQIQRKSDKKTFIVGRAVIESQLKSHF